MTVTIIVPHNAERKLTLSDSAADDFDVCFTERDRASSSVALPTAAVESSRKPSAKRDCDVFDPACLRDSSKENVFTGISQRIGCWVEQFRIITERQITYFGAPERF